MLVCSDFPKSTSCGDLSSWTITDYSHRDDYTIVDYTRIDNTIVRSVFYAVCFVGIDAAVAYSYMPNACALRKF